MSYKYTETWFIGSEIQTILSSIFKYSLFFDKKEYNILEIGCFEGLSSVFFADNLLDHEKSTLTCVDPFLTIDTNDHRMYLQNNQELHFDYNTSVCKNSQKITIHKTTSDKFFETNTKTFNFIYIDGCHEPDFIKRDMENSFKCLEKGGIMWMDDYSNQSNHEIKNTMNRFLEQHKDEYELLHMNYQLAIKKL